MGKTGLLCVLVGVAQLCGQAPDFDGRVVEDSSGNPLASAEVRFRKVGMRELAADLDTDREGRLRASGLPAGDYTIEIAKPNYVTATLKLPLPVSGVFVRLVRYASVTGQVTDQQGRPVPGRISAPYGRTIGGARITVLVKAEGAGGFRQVREVELGDEGRFRIFDLPPGEYAVALWYDGLKDGSGVSLYPDNAHPRIFTVAGGEEFRDVDFQIAPRPAFAVTGKVQLPRPKMKFALALGLPEQPLLPVAQTLTEDDGAFRFERIAAGTYDLFVAGPDAGYGAHASVLGPEPFYGRTRVQVNGANVSGLDLAVAPGRSLAVKLGARGADKPPEGCPMSAAVAVELLEPWGVISRDAGAQAVFGKEQTLRNLAPGRVRLNASGLGATCYQAEPPVVDLGGEASGPVTIEVAAAGSIRGTLLAGAARAAEFVVVLLEPDASAEAPARLASPDAEGRFSFDALRPGSYRIAARPAAEGTRARWVSDVARMIDIQIPGGAPTTVELPAALEGGRQ